jgi:predicted dehydrogenase
MNRRSFLTTSAAGLIGASSALRPQTAAAAMRVQGANDRVRVGVIGTGRQGRSVMNGHLRLDDVDVVAVCDVYAPNMELGAKLVADRRGTAPRQVTDFRQILDDTTIDAVIIGTPDHWHALQTVMACQAGKDVYVEKPTSVAIAEGRRMVEAARRHKRIVQVGTQQRSAQHFQQAMTLVRSGLIGKVTAVRCWNVGNQAPDGIGNPPDSDPPAGLDWDMWLGPAPKRPFNANRFGVYENVFSYFRYFWDYAGGMMTDWGVHLIDIVQWAMDVEAPLSVSAAGGKFCLTDNRETPDTIVASYQYPGFVMTYENRVCNGRDLNGHGYGIEFYGSDGTLFVDRGGYEIVPEKRGRGEDAVDRTLATTRRSVPDNPTHQRNFIDCVKSRQLPICDVEIGHRSSSTAILGNLAYRSGATVVWDGRAEKVTNGNRKAAELVDVEYRSPWKLTV